MLKLNPLDVEQFSLNKSALQEEYRLSSELLGNKEDEDGFRLKNRQLELQRHIQQLSSQVFKNESLSKWKRWVLALDLSKRKRLEDLQFELQSVTDRIEQQRIDLEITTRSRISHPCGISKTAFRTIHVEEDTEMMWTLDLTRTLSHWPKHAVDWSFFNVDEHSIRNWWIQFMAKTLDSRDFSMDNSRIEFDAQGLAKSIVFLADRAAKLYTQTSTPLRVFEKLYSITDLSCYVGMSFTHLCTHISKIYRLDIRYAFEDMLVIIYLLDTGTRFTCTRDARRFSSADTQNLEMKLDVLKPLLIDVGRRCSDIWNSSGDPGKAIAHKGFEFELELPPWMQTLAKEASHVGSESTSMSFENVQDINESESACYRKYLSPLSLPEVRGVFRKEKELGRGSFGAVFQMRNTRSDKIYAFKTAIPKEDEPDLNLRGVRRFAHESLIWWKAQGHESILALEGYHLETTGEHTLASFVSTVCLFNVETFVRQELPPDESRMQLVHDIALGLEHIHFLSRSIIHGDIRAANILVKKNSVWERHRAVLADFGAAEFDDESIATERRATNKRWLAPELLNVLASRNSSKVEEVHSIDGAGASDTVSVYEDCNSVFLSDSDNNNDGDAEESDGTESCATELVVSNEVVRMVSKPGDIYAFGCTVLEILCQKKPFSSMSDEDFELRLSEQKLDTLPVDRAQLDSSGLTVRDSVWALMKECWSPREARPNAKKLVTLVTECCKTP